jgi:Mg2+/Co2+ transporter CorC
VLDRLGRQPETNDKITNSGHQFTVTAVAQNRIQQVQTTADETASPQD